MKRLTAPLVLIISIWGQPLNAQDLHQTYELTRWHLALGEFDAAESLMKRLLYFDSDHVYRKFCLLEMSRLSRSRGNTQVALNYLDQVYFLETDLVQQRALAIERVSILIELTDFQRALAEIYQVDWDNDRGAGALFEGFCLYMLGEFQQAHTVFLTLCVSEDCSSQVNKYLKKANKIDKMKPTLYQTLSHILPGSGQLLLGDAGNSLNSLMLTGGLITLFVYSAQSLSLFDASLAILPWFYRYYTGGAKLTRQLVYDKKAAKHRRNLSDLLASFSLENQFYPTE